MTEPSISVSGAIRPIINVVEDGGVRIVKILVPGPPGPSAPTHIHTQTSPSTTWTISHNLGLKPSVELLNTASQEIDGDVFHPSDNVTVVNFNIPVAGLARLT
jgi:hypothetical protein